MSRKLRRPGLLKGMERAIKLKDLEIAKSFEIDQNKKEQILKQKNNDSRIKTPNIRSELPKE